MSKLTSIILSLIITGLFFFTVMFPPPKAFNLISVTLYGESPFSTFIQKWVKDENTFIIIFDVIFLLLFIILLYYIFRHIGKSFT